MLDSRTGQQQATLDTNVAICALAVGEALKTLVVGTCNGELAFLEDAARPAWNPVSVFVDDGVYSLAYGAEDQLVVAGGSDQTSVWQVSPWQQLAAFESETTVVAGDGPFSPDGRWLVTSSPELGLLPAEGGEIRVHVVPGGP